jgi:hypothetical protein
VTLSKINSYIKYSLNWLNVIKIWIQIHDLGALEFKHILSVMIINVTYLFFSSLT